MNVSLLLLLSGCTLRVFFPPDLWQWDSGGFDTGLVTTDETPAQNTSTTRISKITWACTESPDTWTFTALTDGWTSSATLDIVRTGDNVTETHTLQLVDTDPEGAWDELKLGPIDGNTAYVAGDSTAFSCKTDDQVLSYGIRLHNHVGDTTDCVVWGLDPGAVSARLFTEDPGVADHGGCRIN
jgi:hypothetical protein